MSKYDIIILAGGLGTRLRSVVPDRPKVIAPINGRPFLDIIMEGLSEFSSIGRVILAVGHKAEQIIELYGQNKKYPFDIDFSVERDPLGTGGAIKKALSMTSTDDVIALNGDSFTEVSLKNLVGFHCSMNTMMTMVVVHVEDVSRFGKIVLNDIGRLVLYKEKHNTVEPGYINAGIYIFKRILFEKVPDKTKISFERDLILQFMENGIYSFAVKGRFIDIGTPESYAASSNILKGRVQ